MSGRSGSEKRKTDTKCMAHRSDTVWIYDGVSLRKDGCYINEIRVTDENILETVRLSGKPYISLRIGVRPDAVNQGGINLFGEKYGDFPQGINMRIVY